jgi:MerR family transcriptional regulator, light-induced transcriptional regulator
MASKISDPDEITGLAADPPVPESLVSTLEHEIVPRLLMLSRSARTASDANGTCANATAPGDVEELARLLLAHGPEVAYEFAEALRHRGVTHDRIFMDLLFQAALQLAERWESQDLDYPQLMQGLGALRTVVKRYQ